MDNNGRVIVALDFDSAKHALALVAQLGESAQFYKVGLQLLTAEGPSVVGNWWPLASKCSSTSSFLKYPTLLQAQPRLRVSLASQ